MAQSKSKQLEKIESQFANLSYADAIQSIKEVLPNKKLENSERLDLQKKLAYAYYYTKQYQLAEPAFEKLINSTSGISEDSDVYLRFAQILASNGKHARSSDVYKKYASLTKGSASVGASEQAELLENPEPLFRNAESFEIKYLPINSGNSDFSPIPYKNGLVFVSGRKKTEAIQRVFEWDNSPFLDLYYFKDRQDLLNKGLAILSTDNNGIPKSSDNPRTAFSSANDSQKLHYPGTSDYKETPSEQSSELSKGLNSVYHEGPCTFFNNENSIIFTRNGIEGYDTDAYDKINRVHLYMADRVNGDWANWRAFPYNSPNYSTGHPTFNAYENILFFVSDMPGGFGGTDIYYTKFENGKWYSPVNAGSKVNTAGNEMFPFVSADNVLYFSSDGHVGLGGLDLYSVPLALNGKVAGVVQNLGAPLNSNLDDFGIWTSAELKEGYFSSNRKRGENDDDIYSFYRLGDQSGCKDVILTVKDATNENVLPNLSFNYYTVSEPNLISEGTTGRDGTIKLCLDGDSEYYFEFQGDNLAAKRNFFSAKVIPAYKLNEHTFYLDKTDGEDGVQLMVHNRSNSTTNNFTGVIFGKGSKPVEGVKVRFKNRCTEEEKVMVTGFDGKYAFDRDPSCDYEFMASKPGFATSFEIVGALTSSSAVVAKNSSTSRPRSGSTTYGNSGSSTSTGSTSSNRNTTASSTLDNLAYFNPKVYRVGDAIKLNHLYYDDTDEAVSLEARQELDEIVNVLQLNPDMILDLIVHSDSKGSIKDNLVQTQRRADLLKAYLIRRGIASARVRAVGRGELDLVNECSDGVQCIDAEHRRNRRVEFKILKVSKI